MKYVFITHHKKVWPVDVMCRVLGVSRNAWYRYCQRRRQRSAPAAHQAMLSVVRELARDSGYSYGSRRIQRALQALGYCVGRYRARSLMRQADVHVRYRKKYKVTTNSKHRQPVFDNVLERKFTTTSADQAYVSDITYIWTQAGWLYLAVCIDLYSRRVVGWSMRSRMNRCLATDALRMAIDQRRPSAGLVVHTDRGSQYASYAWRRLVKAHGLVGSMSRKGNCWDNAVAESFFASLKKERVHSKHYQTRAEAQRDILNYIVMFYNSRRPHSYLGYVSPNQYEAAMTGLKKAA